MDSHLIKIQIQIDGREYEHTLEKNDLDEVLDSIFTGLKVVNYTNSEIKSAVSARFLHLLINKN